MKVAAMEKIKLTLFQDGQEWSAELSREPIVLDDLTWEWLKGAFKAIGFSDNQVNEFFDEPSDEVTK